MINCLHICPTVFYTGDVIFSRSTTRHRFCQLFSVGRIGHRDDVRAFSHRDRQVQVIIGKDKALVLVLGHVAIQVVEIVVASKAGAGLESFGGIARIGHKGEPVGAQRVAISVSELVYYDRVAGQKSTAVVGFDIAIQVVGDI